MKAMDHTRCSELLGPFLAGTLADEEARSVEDHLAGCAECRAELAAVRALQGPEARLTDDERALLEAGVRSALETGIEGRIEPQQARGGDVIPLRRRRTWLPQALAGAATVLIVAFGFAALQGGVGGGDDEGGGGGEGSAGSGGGAAADMAGPLPRTITLGSGERLTATTEGKVADQYDADAAAESAEDGAAAGGEEPVAAEPEASGAVPPEPSPTERARANRNVQNLAELRSMTPEALTKFGRTAPVLRRFGRSYTTDHLGLAPEFRDALVADAPRDLRDQVAECSEVVLESRPSLPAVAVYGPIDGKRSVVLGFAWSNSGAGALDRFMIWAWSRGSCETPSLYLAGRIRT